MNTSLSHLSRRRLLTTTGVAALTASFSAIGANARPAVGISLPLTGVQGAVAKELRAGYEAALAPVADLVIVDDESKADKTAVAYEGFARDGSIAAATGIVGTPHAKKALPHAVAGGLPVVGIRSGADDLRDGNPWVWHLRASYGDELKKVVGVASVYQSIGILYSDDDFGKVALKQATAAAAAVGLKVAAAIPCERNGTDVKQQAAKLIRLQGVSCVLLCLIQKPAMEAAMELRGGQRFMMPVYGMSFIATAQLATSDPALLHGVALVSPFPLARISTLGLAEHFRQSMNRARTPELIVSPTAFEGFFYGSVLADAIVRGGSKRKEIQSYLAINRPWEVREMRLRFDEQRVGYRFLTLLHKDGLSLRT